jgi:hypothetical protein
MQPELVLYFEEFCFRRIGEGQPYKRVRLFQALTDVLDGKVREALHLMVSVKTDRHRWVHMVIVEGGF